MITIALGKVQNVKKTSLFTTIKCDNKGVEEKMGFYTSYNAISKSFRKKY